MPQENHVPGNYAGSILASRATASAPTSAPVSTMEATVQVARASEGTAGAGLQRALGNAEPAPLLHRQRRESGRTRSAGDGGYRGGVDRHPLIDDPVEFPAG